MVAATIAIAAFSASAQLALVPPAHSAYLLRSGSFYSPQERQEADAVFAHYRREGKPEEPVIASTFLFRYAHDRNLFWLDRLHGRPAPIWILGDSADPYVRFRISADMINASSGIKMEDYTVIDRRGRFVLLRRKDWRQREDEARRVGTAYRRNINYSCGHQRRVRVTVKKAAQARGNRRLRARSTGNNIR